MTILLLIGKLGHLQHKERLMIASPHLSIGSLLLLDAQYLRCCCLE